MNDIDRYSIEELEAAIGRKPESEKALHNMRQVFGSKAEIRYMGDITPAHLMPTKIGTCDSCGLDGWEVMRVDCGHWVCTLEAQHDRGDFSSSTSKCRHDAFSPIGPRTGLGSRMLDGNNFNNWSGCLNCEPPQ